MCNKVSSASLQKTQTGESTSCRWNKKRPVGSKLYNNFILEPYETFLTCSPENVIEDCLSINFNSKDFDPFFYALWCLTSPYKA